MKKRIVQIICAIVLLASCAATSQIPSNEAKAFEVTASRVLMGNSQITGKLVPYLYVWTYVDDFGQHCTTVAPDYVGASSFHSTSCSPADQSPVFSSGDLIEVTPSRILIGESLITGSTAGLYIWNYVNNFGEGCTTTAPVKHDFTSYITTTCTAP